VKIVDFWATPRHLGKQCGRCLLAHGGGPVTTAQLADWAYPRPRQKWHYLNVRRHMQSWGFQPVGRVRADRSLLWELRRLEDIDPPDCRNNAHSSDSSSGQ
jgi:hypothetical protein